MAPARRAQQPPDADPAAGLPFDADEFESRLAWIMGSPRTGSTWLLRLLVHPLVLGRRPSGLRKRRRSLPRLKKAVLPINESHVPLHLTPLDTPRFEDDVPQPPPAEFLMNTRHADRPSYLFSDAHGDVAWPWVRAMVLARFQAQADSAARDQRVDDYVVAIKEPNGSHGAQLVMSLLPRARLVFLMRDGRDVVDSSLALRQPGGPRSGRGRLARDPEDRLGYVIRDSRLWVNRMNAVGAAYDAHSPELRLRLRYEDLRANTVRELTRVDRFLGVDRERREREAAVDAEAFESLPDARKGVERGRRAATPGLWKESLTPTEQRVAEEIMGDKLAELGYEV